jgi:uncharacterized protein YgbK (DUF1537 family)
MIVVIADDISGAAELAGVAARHGLTAEVQTRFKPGSPAQVVALDTDTRCLPATEAARALREAGAQVIAAQPAWFYKKTDSVLRGPVRTEITALLEATGKRRALLIPANPSRQRVIRGGHYYVNDTPLDRTVFRSDPEHPAQSSAVIELLERSPGAPVRLWDGSGSIPDSGILVPDVQTPADLVQFAKSADEPNTLCAGASEFFDALLSVRLPQASASRLSFLAGPARTLIVCGSAAAWPIRLRECHNRRIPVFPLPTEVFFGNLSEITLSQLVAGVVQSLAMSGCGLVAIGEPSLPAGCAPKLLVERLAQVVKHLVQKAPVDRLLLEGGATASALLREMGWTRLAVVGHFAADLAAFRPLDGPAPAELTVGIKPGTYPWPEVF